jgi:uncharacterized protein
MSQPVLPLRQFVLKVHARCDLSCDHCYVYEGADQSWGRRPVVMPDSTVARIVQRIAEHAATHNLQQVNVVLHGGEPLLVGVSPLEKIIKALREGLTGRCDLDLRIHTNGVQLNEQFCDMFARHGCKVGISIDGDRAANDRHRRYASGRSSYNQVVRAINLIRSASYRHLYLGLLCTIDLHNDPLAVYKALLDFAPPRIDFLLPHATWDEPPWRPSGQGSDYADWLITIFDHWNADGRQPGIRLFDSIIRTARGQQSLTESLGLTPSDLIVLETDGSYEQVDSLKVTFDGAPATGFNVFSHSLDDVAGHPGIMARQSGRAGLCQQCQSCPVVSDCGGGLYTHRYRQRSGFQNPSVYCDDLMKLITHVRGHLPGDGAERSPHPVHAIAPDELDALASGFGGAEAVRQLAGTQSSLRRALLGAVGAQSGRTGAWEVLSQADRAQPPAVETVLNQPFVRAWAVRCLERAGSRSGEPDGGTTADRQHLSAVAIAAAIRAGIGATAEVPVRDGAVYLPSLGRLMVPRSAPDAVATVEPDAQGLVTVRVGRDEWRATWTPAPAGLDFGEAPTALWQPVRHLAAPGLTVALEDIDPYRDCYHRSAAPRVSGEEFTDWETRFRDAWALIREEYSAYAPGMAAGLTTVVPLSAAAADREVSATARDAFGAVAAALPADAATLALLLIHEFQHVKLGGILDLGDLFDPADTRLFHAPWRTDPRPLEGLLQGTYAHIAVTDFWRGRRHAGGAAGEVAAARFAHWRAGTADAIETLAGSGSLTPLGERFVRGMRATVRPWLDEPVARAAASVPVASGSP